MKFISKPLGASKEKILEIEKVFSVSLSWEIIDWWKESDGPIVYFGYKELQFFSVGDIVGEDIYQLRKYMPNAMPICMDGNCNICVAKIVSGLISGFYVANCGDLGWDEAKLISKTFFGFINDRLSPDARLHA
jgi:hypothetical protein